MIKKAILSALAISFVLALVFLIAQKPAQHTHRPLIPSRDITEFHLVDHNGQTFGLDQLKGSWTMIFFGYTQCPDICPTALGLMVASFAILGKEGKTPAELKGLFVSVDPKRDTPPILQDYVQYFHPSIVGVTGTKLEIDNLVHQMGAVYTIHAPEDPNDPETYAVTHSSSIYFVNPQGRLVDMVLDPKTPEEISNTLLALGMGTGRQPFQEIK